MYIHNPLKGVSFMRFEALIGEDVELVFSVVMPYGRVGGYKCFGESYYLHLQCWRCKLVCLQNSFSYSWTKFECHLFYMMMKEMPKIS
jgi:hypothetical protein